jgi:hypothetical protein
MTVKTSYGELTGDNDLLNTISLFLRIASSVYSEGVNKWYGEQAFQISDEIYQSLKQNGYYEFLK